MSKKWTKGGQGANSGQQPPPPECRFGDFPRVQAVRIESSSEDNQRYTNEQTDRTTQIGLSSDLNWITGIAAVVSFLALVVLGVSLHYSQVATNAAVSQAKTAQSEFESSQRPWVSVSVVGVGKLFIRANMMYISPTVFVARNSGHSVAEHVSYHGYIVPSDKENGTECDEAAQAIKSAGKYPIGAVIFPGDEVKGTFDAFDFGGVDEEFKTSSTPGAMAPRLVACIVYTSPVDKVPHYTRVVYWIYHQGTQNPTFTRDAESYDIEIASDINGSTAN